MTEKTAEELAAEQANAEARNALTKAAEQHPTVEEAKAMFAGNPNLFSVMTDEGNMLRDGTLQA